MSFFRLETAQSIVVTAQRGLSNCAAAHARSLEGTLVATYLRMPHYHAKADGDLLYVSA